MQTKELSGLIYNYTYLCILLGMKVLVYPHQTLILRNYEMSQVNIASMRKQNKLSEYYSRINTLMVFLGQIHVHAMITTVLVCFIQMKCNISQISLQFPLHFTYLKLQEAQRKMKATAVCWVHWHHCLSGLLISCWLILFQ